jgi:cyclomaltodextrinase
MVKEFIFILPYGDVESVHIGIFPSYGRYFRKKMEDDGKGFFRGEIEAAVGEIYYHYFLNNDFSQPLCNNPEELITKNDPLKRSAINIETEPFCALQFDGGEKFIFPVRPGVWVLRAVSHHSWIQSVSLLGNHPEEIPFQLAHRFGSRKYWTLRLDVPLKQDNPFTTFALKIKGKDRQLVLHKNKTFKKIPDQKNFFVFPGKMQSKTRKEKAVFPYSTGYQVFPDRFFKAGRQTAAHQVHLSKWGDKPDHYSYFGGDLQGIREKIPYLSELGVDFLYLNPIFHAKTYHRYDTIDYYRIDPLLGNDTDLEELVDAAHRSGIKMILDIPLNHCSVDFFAFKDLLEKQECSQYCDWFNIRRYPVEVVENHRYGSWHGYKDMPEFNLDNPLVRDYLIAASLYWLKKFDIDGWRLDTCSSLPMSFVRQFVKSTEKVKKEAVVIGEYWHNNGSRLFEEGRVNGLTNYSLYWKVIAPLFEKEPPALAPIADAIMNLNYRYPYNHSRYNWNFLSNHDLPRLYSVMSNTRNYKSALVLLYALPGHPVIYYGEEIGLPGKGDPDNRRCMEWSPSPRRKHPSFIQLCKFLNHLRKNHQTIFSEGNIAIPYVDSTHSLLILQRFANNESLYFIFNFGSERVKIHLSEILNQKELIEPTSSRFSLEAYDQVVFFASGGQGLFLKKPETCPCP